jgi:HSP20 family molecular chaperone IbpA
LEAAMTDWFGGKKVGNLQDEVNRVFTDFGLTPPPAFGAMFGGLTSQPRVEVEKTKTGYEIEIAFPFQAGPEHIDAEFRDGRLVITVERPKESGGAKVDIRTAGASGGGSAGTAQPQGGVGGGSTTGSEASSSGPGGMMGEGGGETERREGMLGEGV